MLPIPGEIGVVVVGFALTGEAEDAQRENRDENQKFLAHNVFSSRYFLWEVGLVGKECLLTPLGSRFEMVSAKRAASQPGIRNQISTLFVAQLGNVDASSETKPLENDVFRGRNEEG